MQQKSVADYMMENEDRGINNKYKNTISDAAQYKTEQAKKERLLGIMSSITDQYTHDQAVKMARAEGFDVPDGVYDPRDVDMAIKQLSAGSGSDTPSSVKEWSVYNAMSPEAQEQYLQMKRANPYLNLGDRMAQPNPIRGGYNNPLPINPKVSETPDYQAQQERAKLEEKNRVEAEAGLGNTLANADKTVNLIESMVGRDAEGVNPALPEDPGFRNAVGLRSYLPTIKGSEAADFEAKFEQLQGGAFLDAFESLKGGGQITQVEGEKATAAINRAKLSQSPKAFKEAVNEFKAIVKAGAERARAKAARPNLNTPVGGMNSQQGGDVPLSDPLSKAREAIARGADPVAVKKRLEDAGYSTEGI
jgi:hypothetical protein